MDGTIQTISITNLAIAFIPLIPVFAILIYWSLGVKDALHSLLRMLGQLLIIGYLLGFIFQANHFSIIVLVLAIMVLSASWIALRTVEMHRRALYFSTLTSVLLGGGFVLWIVTQGVLDLSPWYQAQYMIPLAGMIFANSMNCVSLCAERIHTETQRGTEFTKARNLAFHAALIPVINSLFAVGLVSLPGMMTGQILSGVSPLIAARYQIVVMCMIFSSAGLSTACFLFLTRKYFSEKITIKTND